MLYTLLEKPEIVHYLANKTMFSAPTDISWFNFSGIGAAFQYNGNAKIKWIFPIRDGYEKYLPQIIFHSIWGTYATDESILENMTGKTVWYRRSVMGDAFKHMGTSPPRQVALLEIKKFAKMCSANQTGLLSLSSNPMIGHSAISARHVQMFTDEFMDYINSSIAPTTGITKTIETLKNLMSQVRQSLFDGLTKDRQQKRGTTPWHSMADATKTTYGKELEDCPVATNKIFMRTD